jgi:hypothetical protein
MGLFYVKMSFSFKNVVFWSVTPCNLISLIDVLDCCLGHYTSTLKMEAAGSSGKSLDYYYIKRLHITQDSILLSDRSKNFEFPIPWFV